ncbi:MAG: transposase [Anaerolineae bacterium]|nr:transposase [Gloeobacterales cyanobacterium ES-bin-313]
MSRTLRFFSPEFKLQVVREVEAGATAAQVARLHQLHPNLLAQCQALENISRSWNVCRRAAPAWGVT